MSHATAYLLLGVSIATELIATSALPATEGWRKLKPGLISACGYFVCFLTLGFSLSRLHLGIAYATWGAIGTVITAIIGYLLYHQKISRTGAAAIIMIAAGVVILNLFG